jgi:hypothetical protein
MNGESKGDGTARRLPADPHPLSDVRECTAMAGATGPCPTGSCVAGTRDSEPFLPLRAGRAPGLHPYKQTASAGAAWELKWYVAWYVVPQHLTCSQNSSRSCLGLVAPWPVVCSRSRCRPRSLGSTSHRAAGRALKDLVPPRPLPWPASRPGGGGGRGCRTAASAIARLFTFTSARV